MTKIPGVKLIHPPGTLIVSILLFIFSFLLIGKNLDKPFWGEHDWNGVRYGNIARNYLRYGLLETKLGQVENSGPAKPNEFEYYTHYPPLLPLFIAISYRFFGISEWSTRLVPTFFSSLSIVLIFLIGSKLWDFRIGVLAGVVALATPMVLYFGKNASHEPLTLFFILFAAYGYISMKNLKYGKLIFTLGLMLAHITAWAGFFLLPALTLTHFLRREFTQMKNLVPYWILSLALFGIHLLHVNILTGEVTGGNLFASFMQRTGLLAVAQPPGFNLPNYLNQLRLWFSTLYTLTLSLLSIFWLVVRRFSIKSNDWPVLTLGVVGIIYIILFSNSVFIHNYLIFYFLPFLSLVGASAIFWMADHYDTLVYHNKFIPTFIILFFLAVILFERYSFLTALNNSEQDKFAVEVGRAIKKSSNWEDTILVSPIKFSYSADKFLRFYSDRRLIYSDDDQVEHDVKVSVDQDKGEFEIIAKEEDL